MSFGPGEPEVELGDGAVGTPLGLDRSDSSRSMTPLDDEAELMDSRLLTQVESNREVEDLQTKTRRGAVCGNSSRRSCTEEWRVFSVNS